VYRSSTGIFPRRRVAVEAVRDVEFVVEPGELFGLLGPNGAGKTTTIKVLSTLLLPSSGSARVLGFDVARQAREVRRRIGYVFGGDRGLYDRLSALDNLSFFADGLPRCGVREARPHRRVARARRAAGPRARAGGDVFAGDAAAASHRAGAPPRPACAVPRRAHDRARPGRSPGAAPDRRGAARRWQDDPAHDPLHVRGRRALPPDRTDRGRPDRRRRDAGRAESRGRGPHDRRDRGLRGIRCSTACARWTA
jgi:hypothetical protein